MYFCFDSWYLLFSINKCFVLYFPQKRCLNLMSVPFSPQTKATARQDIVKTDTTYLSWKKELLYFWRDYLNLPSMPFGLQHLSSSTVSLSPTAALTPISSGSQTAIQIQTLTSQKRSRNPLNSKRNSLNTLPYHRRPVTIVTAVLATVVVVVLVAVITTAAAVISPTVTTPTISTTEVRTHTHKF